MRPVFRGALIACVLLGSTTLIGSAATADANTPPDCAGSATTSFQVQEIQTGGNDASTPVDVIPWCVDDDPGTVLSITHVDGPVHGSATIKPADPENGHDFPYVLVTPVTDFVYRDVVTVTVSDGTATTDATVYLHVVGPTDTVDCGPTNTLTSTNFGDPVDQSLSCYSNATAPDNKLTYSFLNVSPADQASHVSFASVDPGDGSDPYEVLRFDGSVTKAIDVELRATDGTGASDDVFVHLDIQRDPDCAGADEDHLALIEQRSSNHATLTQPLFCHDPDGNPITYGAPVFQAPNNNPTPPGTLTIDPATSNATFVPTDPDWAGIAFWSVEVTDTNNGYYGLQIEVSRYQQADLATTVTTPASATIGTTFVTHLRMQNHGPDTVTGTYADVALPYGVQHGALPSGCTNQAPRYFECTFPTLAPDADVTVAIPVTATGASFPGTAHIGALVGSDNLRDDVPANDSVAATLTLKAPTSGTGAADVFHGSTGGDTYNAGGGPDHVSGGPGGDTLLLGAGNDCGQGDAGNDVLRGGSGSDVEYGDTGKCLATSAPVGGRFLASVVTGNDRLFGDAGNDVLHGGPGSDVLVGGIGNDKLYGDAGKDRFVGGAGNDVIFALDHVKGEVISCGPGKDVVHADKGDKVARDCEKVLRR